MRQTESAPASPPRPALPARPRVLLRTLLGLMLALVGCGDDGGAPAEPGVHEGVDRIVFEFYRTDLQGIEMLVWRGTVAGPLPDSPEATPIPWIGYRQPFRVAWHAESANAPIVGTRVRPGIEPGAPFLAIDPPEGTLWGTGNSFRFANAIPPGELEGVVCPSGLGCPDRVRFPAGPCSLRVLALDQEGEILDPELGNLQYHVNFAPSAEWVTGTGDEERDPYWTAIARDGSVLRRPYAPGDTIPSGARLHLVMRGRDRFFGITDPDSACCDQRLDDQGPAVRFQARTHVERKLSPSLSETRQTVFGPLAADSVLTLLVGPFDYRLGGRASDEHDERSETVEFEFIGGLPPRISELAPPAGAEIELRAPDQPIPTGDDGPLYEVIPAQRRWDEARLDWGAESGTGRLWDGSAYRIPLRIRAAAHPTADLLQPTVVDGLTDHARSFAYELLGEFDPFNRRQNGIRDDIDRFTNANGFEALDLEGEEGYELFVPTLFWTQPSWFVPELVGETECLFPELQEFCDIGERMRSDLGRFVYRAQASSSALFTEFGLNAPLPADSTGVEIPLEYLRFATRTPLREQEFSVRLRVEVEGETVSWPPPPRTAR